MSNLINKAKDVLSGHKDHSNTTGTTSTTHGGAAGTYDDPRSTNAGPHSSNIANKADPRVDSDYDNRNDPTSRVGGYGTQGQGTHTATTGSGLHSGTTGGIGGTHTGAHTGGIGGTHTGAGYGTTGTSTNAGPHDSNLMNKLDPRIDSDRDNRNDPTSRVGGYGTQSAGTGGSGLTGGGGSGLIGTHGTSHGTHGTSGGIGGTHSGAGYGTTGTSTNAGPHDSNLANKLDPRVDSDRDNYNNTGGYGTQQTHGGSGLTGSSGLTGAGGVGHGTTGHTGVHGTTSTHGTTGTHGVAGTHGTGAANDNTTTAAGLPSQQENLHKNKLANKLDPRVKVDENGNPAY